MSNIKTTLSFESPEVKDLLAKFDVEYFFKQNILENEYTQDQIDSFNTSYQNSIRRLKKERKQDKKQFSLYTEGQARKMFRGGFLPALFHLDNGKKHTIVMFEEAGDDMGYFKLWQEYHKRKITTKKAWNVIVKTGSVLAIILTVIKLIEVLLSA